MKTNSFAAWGAAQLFFVLGVLVAVIFAILSDSITRELLLSGTELGLLGGSFFAAYAISQLVFGILIARVPAGRLLGICALVSAAGVFLFSAVAGFDAALAARVLMGIGLGSSFVGVIHLVGRRFGGSFAFMSALSQSLANLCAAGLAITSGLVPFLGNFRFAFQILGFLFVGSAALLFLLARDLPPPPVEGNSTSAAFLHSIRSPQFWAALVFYSGTFGTLLAFADLWNIQFQMNFFHHPVRQSAMMNSMIPLGVTAGGLVSGWWAGRIGIALPARVFTILALLCFGLLALFPLPASGAGALMFLIGFSLGGSTLGLACLHQQLPAAVAPVATSLVVTAAFVFGGILQPLVGAGISGPHGAAGAEFVDYQRGVAWLLSAVCCASAAAFVFRSAQAGDLPQK